MGRSGVIGCLLIFLTTMVVGPSFADKVYPVPWHIPYRDEFVAHKTYIGEDRIPAILLQRRELVGKRKPAAIVLHGATSQKEHTLGFAPSIARWGTLVVAVDAYGHGERKDEELQSKLQGPERGRMLRRVIETTAREIPAVVDYLIERDDVDGERIACVGGSMGGFIVSLVATSEHRIKAFVMMGAGSTSNALLRKRRAGGSASLKTLTTWHDWFFCQRFQQPPKCLICRAAAWGWASMPKAIG